MERRTILRLIAAGCLAPANPDGLVSIAAAQQERPYQPLFFTPEQMQTIEALTEILIPADAHSGGARAARVNRFFDVMIAEAPEPVRAFWRDLLGCVDRAARERFGRPFHEGAAEEQASLVAAMASNEDRPDTELQRCFGPLKRMTVDGYYLSRIGIHEELEYQGNTALAEFPGCEHAGDNHRA